MLLTFSRSLLTEKHDSACLEFTCLSAPQVHGLRQLSISFSAKVTSSGMPGLSNRLTPSPESLKTLQGDAGGSAGEMHSVWVVQSLSPPCLWLRAVDVALLLGVQHSLACFESFSVRY